MKAKLTTEQKLEMVKVLVNHDMKQLVYRPHCERCRIARKMGTVIYCGCISGSGVDHPQGKDVLDHETIEEKAD